MTIKIAAFYHFSKFDEYQDFQHPINQKAQDLELKGIILLAKEGINSTIAGEEQSIDIFLDYLRSLDYFKDLQVKFSYHEKQPFLRLKVRLKKEIVTLKAGDIDPTLKVGRYIHHDNWNDFIRQDDVVVIDTRNDYEVDIGTFHGSINPKTSNFSDFPKWVEENKDILKNKKIAMFCTGGIRCEKSTSYMLQQGYKDVFHLEGGILKYLEHIDEKKSAWQGDCFVFDRRVAVKHGLEVAEYEMCGGCRRPVSKEGKQKASYELGVSCEKCIDETTDTQKKSFRERQKQLELAEIRNQHHMGDKTLKKASMTFSKQEGNLLPILYTFRRCPYAMRARMALFSGVDNFILREIVLRDKPLEMLLKSPKATVPVFCLPDGKVIDESIDVMLYALARYQEETGKHHPWFGDDETFKKMMELIHENDTIFKTHLDRYKYPTRYQNEWDEMECDTQEKFSSFHFEKALIFIKKLENLLSKNTYLFAEKPLFADIAIFSFYKAIYSCRYRKFSTATISKYLGMV